MPGRPSTTTSCIWPLPARSGTGGAKALIWQPESGLRRPWRCEEGYRVLRAVAGLPREIGNRRGGANASWNLGLAFEKAGDLRRAAEMMQICVGYERDIGHPDAEKDALRLEAIRAKMKS